MLMENIKIYVIVRNQEPHFLFERIEDYSSMRGYLAKAHPLYTHRFTKYVEKAMHFLTIKEALDFIQTHKIDGSIIKEKDLNEERCPNSILKNMEMLSLTCTTLWGIQAIRCFKLLMI